MRIAVVFNGSEAPCYAWSYVEAFSEMGHEVHVNAPGVLDVDFALEIENGRNQKGELIFYYHVAPFAGKTAVLLVDSHGHPDLHAEVAKSYDHVFFAVWSRRDLFAGHPSAHWCPNATDLKWFGTPEQLAIEPTIDFGFFGSKRGLSRADDMVAICKANGWRYDVRQVASNRNPNRWPATGDAMARCRVLFNRGQKHDGPNQRVMESMAMGRLLITDRDLTDGMDKLFEAGTDYLPYLPDAEGLARTMEAFRVLPRRFLAEIAERGRKKVEAKHLIKHRAAQILEVIG